MILHVITAVSRPWNLGVIAGSLASAAARAAEIKVSWHCHFDIDRSHVGGQALKNAMLDDISDGWVWILDDDTLVHELLFSSLQDIIEENPKMMGLIVSQRRNDGRVLTADLESVKVSSIDAGQALLSRALIADYRLPEDYEGDGLWLEEILLGRDDIIYLDEVLSLHNVLSGVDISPYEAAEDQ